MDDFERKDQLKICGNDKLSDRLSHFQEQEKSSMAKSERKEQLKICGNDKLSYRVNQFQKQTKKSEIVKTEKKEQVKIYGNDKLSERVNQFQKQAEKTEAQNKSNPFSKTFNPSTSTCFSKDDPRYGKPPEGSKTEMRGKKAHSHISREIFELCSIIEEFGNAEENGSYWISFGALFKLYNSISNKVVGLLLRGRKHGLIHFEGEMLFQRRDDNVIITLLPFEEDSNEEEDE